MSAFLNPDNLIDDFDGELSELSRGSGQVLNLAAFRLWLDHQPRRSNDRPTVSDASDLTADAATQLRHELDLAFADLGGATFALAHHGALNDPRLAPRVHRIHELYARLNELHGPTSCGGVYRRPKAIVLRRERSRRRLDLPAILPG